VRLHSRTRKPGRPSRGVRVSVRAELRPGCPCPGSDRDRLRGLAFTFGSGSPLLGFLLPSNTSTSGAPCPPHRDLAITAGGVRITRPSPVPSSGFLPLSTVLAALAGLRAPTPPLAERSEYAVDRDAPTLRGLVPCRSRPLESSFRAFPSRGAVPALAGPFSLVGSRRHAQRRGCRSEGFAAPFTVRADHPPQEARGPRGLRWPGRRIPGVARAPHVSRCRGRLRRLVSDRPGSPDSAACTPTPELCSPRESVRGF